MAKFRIMPHSRLQEWVARGEGYFTDEGWSTSYPRQQSPRSLRQPTDQAPVEVKRGRSRDVGGRACEISSAATGPSTWPPTGSQAACGPAYS